MTRSVAVVILVVGMVAAAAAPRSAQAQGVESPVGQLQGRVADGKDLPVSGVLVSVVGTASASETTDSEGRFIFQDLTPGPYLVRTHITGFSPVRASLVQVVGGATLDHNVRLRRLGESQLLAAGLADAAAQEAAASRLDAPVDEDDRERVWRLRHVKRGVLDQAKIGYVVGETSPTSSPMGSPAVADFPVSGQLNFLTSASFERPQDMLGPVRNQSHGVAYLALDAPSAVGRWTLRGAITEGDLSSWALSGGFSRQSPAVHEYRVGVSYTAQRYEGGNAVALAAVADGDRNVGTMYAYDRWNVLPMVTIDYGAEYARYDYLEHPGLLSPELAVTLTAAGFQFRGAAVSRQSAPGATEFQSLSEGGFMSLPPERTFSSLSPDGQFVRERATTFEVSGGRVVPGGVAVTVRGFRQRVDDQVATLFGVSMPRQAATGVGHFHVVSAGDIAADGWGVAASRSFFGWLNGSVDYTESQATWDRTAIETGQLFAIAPDAVLGERERLRNIAATVDAEIPGTATRMFVLYRMIVSRPTDGHGQLPPAATRFDIQVRQELPFLDFTSAEWAMLVGVRNILTEGSGRASIFDELLVIRPPKRIVGGVTIRF